MEAFAETHDGSVQMIDTSIVRVHPLSASISTAVAREGAKQG